jgi:predicted CXXCH cytochrome family protein
MLIRSRVLVRWGFLALLASAAGVAALSTSYEVARPVELGGLEYVRSDTCERCHPSHYQSWHRTFHRTMTQEASPATVVGDFQDAEFTYTGVRSRFFRQGGSFFIETLNGTGEMQQFKIVRTVGSRRVQQYVTRIGDRYIRLPLAWNIEEQRWFHLNGGFLNPDGSPFNAHAALWDGNCIFCHNVKARPGYDAARQTFASSVAELGIACESCHGPGAEHVARNSSPWRRYFLYLSGRDDPTILSPEDMSKERVVQVCGHCHGQRLPNPISRIQEFMSNGDPYTAGDDLGAYTTPIFRDSHLEGVDLSLRFWGDGTPRLSAYEYQGLLMSADYQRGDLTCLSCHSLHAGDRRGNIRPEMRTAAACLQCHRELGADVERHTRHAADGPGSNCYACHMPKITYGLLNMHPSHRITRPDPARAWRYEMPEACTLCHTNQTAVWAARKQAELYGTDTPTDAPAGFPWDVAENVRAMLAGDVLQRAAAVMAAGEPASYHADPVARLWIVPVLLQCMEDRYSSIRHFAYRSLLRVVKTAAPFDSAVERALVLPRFEPQAEPDDRRHVIAEWRSWWVGLDKSGIPHPGEAVPVDDDLQLLPERVAALVAMQRDKDISIGE